MAKRARSEWKPENVDVVLDAKYLLVKAVPLMKNAVRDEQTKAVIKPESLWHVNIQFRDFEDILSRACEKVLHTVGHAIDADEINPDGSPDGITTVLSTGHPPKTEKVLSETAAVLNSATTPEAKESMQKQLLDILAASGLDAKKLAALMKK